MGLLAKTSRVIGKKRPSHTPSKIQRANLDGSNVEALVTTGIFHPAGITLSLTAGKIYWSDNHTRKIQCSNLDGTGIEDVVGLPLAAPGSVDVDAVSGHSLRSLDRQRPAL